MTKPPDAKAPPAAPPPRLPPLRTRRECARYVAQLIRSAHRDDIPLDKARTLTYCVQTLAGLLADIETEERIANVEARLAALADAKP